MFEAEARERMLADKAATLLQWTRSNVWDYRTSGPSTSCNASKRDGREGGFSHPPP